MHWSIVGRPYRVDSTLINPSRADYPSFGTLVGWLARRDGYAGGVPPYVITPFPHCDSTVYITPGQFGGCLGAPNRHTGQVSWGEAIYFRDFGDPHYESMWDFAPSGADVLKLMCLSRSSDCPTAWPS